MKETEPCDSPEVRAQMPSTVLGPGSRDTVPSFPGRGFVATKTPGMEVDGD